MLLIHVNKQASSATSSAPLPSWTPFTEKTVVNAFHSASTAAIYFLNRKQGMSQAVPVGLHGGDCWDVKPNNHVCRNWMSLARQDEVWRNLFIKRWGTDQANFFSPLLPKTWKMAYETQDRCDRVGLGLTITCEGSEYYIVHQGEIQRWLGSKISRNTNYGTPYLETIDRTLSIPNGSNIIESNNTETLTVEKGPCIGLFDKILFFIGDLEKASRKVKRSRIL